METHTFVAPWGEFISKLEDVEGMFLLPLFTDNDTTCILLSEEEERTLQLLNATLGVSNKLTYTS